MLACQNLILEMTVIPPTYHFPAAQSLFLERMAGHDGKKHESHESWSSDSVNWLD